MKQLFILILIVSTCVVTGRSQAYHYDVNGDGEVTVTDITAIYDYLLGNIPVEPSVNHDYVDMGLPSGTLWATMNVGANSPEDYGDYFAWGETVPKEVYSWSTYQWCNGNFNKLIKYCNNSTYGYNGFTDDLTELELEDDAAYVNWGPEWRIPSLIQIKELLNNCTYELTTRNGVSGMLLTSNYNGESLFFPAAGYRSDSSVNYVGVGGYFMSRTLASYTSYYSYLFYFYSNDLRWNTGDRFFGKSVRAVRVSQK